MKNKLFLGAILAVMIGSANAASIALNNFGADFADSLAIANSGSSTAASGGIAAAGYFRTLSASQVATYAADPTIANILLLAADFEVVASTTLDSAFGGAAPNSGLFDLNAGAVTLPNATRAGEGLYTFLGNSGSLLGSTAFLLWDNTAVIDPQDTIANPDSNNLLMAQEGTALISGGTTTVTVDLSGVPDGPSSFQLDAIRLFTPIPEPSTALLGAIGALGLLRRRR